jgi:hypothetical protein
MGVVDGAEAKCDCEVVLHYDTLPWLPCAGGHFHNQASRVGAAAHRHCPEDLYGPHEKVSGLILPVIWLVLRVLRRTAAVLLSWRYGAVTILVNESYMSRDCGYAGIRT